MTSINSVDRMEYLPSMLVSFDNTNISSNIQSTGKYQSPEQTTSATFISTITNPSTTTTAPSKASITATATAATEIKAAASKSTSGTLTVVQSESRTPCINPEQQRSQDTDQDVIWQVLVNLDRLVLEARKGHVLLAAEIEDLMCTLEDYSFQLGIDPSNITHLLVLPFTAPITLITRQTLHRACDDLYQDILRRKEKVERCVSMIITIAENIREPPEPYLETNMPLMSRARILQLESVYRKLESEWLSRSQRFQSMVGMLRVRWEQCAYFPVDDYDHALSRLFELAELHRETTVISCLRIEPPLCLSVECLTSLSTKLAELDQNFYTRQSRIRAMENVLRLIYQDLNTPDDRRVIFRNEATVKYAAELGRELKALHIELAARKLYLTGERWVSLGTVWDTCLVNKQERERFRSAIEKDDVTFCDKLERIQTEMDTCRVQFSRSSVVYKLMMTRRSHIERMISFEHSASDPKRLFQSSFQLVEEEKFRRRAYPTLLKLERTLIEAIELFEREQGESFMYEGTSYLETLQAEIEKRHVNETVFAKFTQVIAAPTRSQTIQIMGRAVSPISSGPLSAPVTKPSQSLRNPIPSVRSTENSRRSNTTPAQAPLVSSSATSSPSQIVSPGKAKEQKPNEEDTNNNNNNNTNNIMASLKPLCLGVKVKFPTSRNRQ
ncbi:hypothetical protein BGZ76_008869 [Entomortierella beljakovae]|nr:hypothetical protein BGZ76_008869 [Entomortierella beljakovae]